MRSAALVLLVIGCSAPAQPNVEPAPTAPPPSATPAEEAAPSAPLVPALDVATFAQVPALTPPPGARLMIGLNVGVPAVALSPAGDILVIAGGMDGVQLIHGGTLTFDAKTGVLEASQPRAGARAR